jgi:hypothetical protein
VNDSPKGEANMVTAQRKAAIFSRLQGIEAALSPENLFNDGEISRGEAMAKKRRLDAERETLIAELGYRPTVGEVNGF